VFASGNQNLREEIAGRNTNDRLSGEVAGCPHEKGPNRISLNAGEEELRAMNKALSFAVALAGIVVAAASVPVFGVRAPTKAPVGIRAAWTQIKWPFLLDQWGIGRAYVCKPADCGVEVNVYFRPKIGFCKCETGVDDDEELERVSDNELVVAKSVALGPGRPIEVGWMKGRSRLYGVSGTTQARVLSIPFNDRCDVIVAVATLGASAPGTIEPEVIAFLNSDPVLRWVKWLIS